VPKQRSPEFQRAWEALQARGLLLESDALLPSVASLVAGVPIKGSWWGHPQGKAIFAVIVELAAHRDAVAVKLVSGKVTWVHRKLWPALLAVARCGEAWQVGGVALPVRAVLSAVRKAGSLAAEDLPGSSMLRKKAVKELEARLLVHAEEIHTETGAHSKIIETWDRWAERVGAPQKRVAADKARARFDAIVRGLDEEFGAAATLPWWEKTRASGKSE
jgi:hypothetical protein